MMNVKGSAIVLTNGMFDSLYAKTAHGLVRGTERFQVKAVIDHQYAGRDAGEVLDGHSVGIPVYESVTAFFEAHPEEAVQYCVVGVAFPGGKLPQSFIEMLKEALHKDLSVVSGLHTYVSEISELVEIALPRGLQLIDIRKPKKFEDLHFWTGDIYKVKAARISVLGMDCAMGKRTTCRFLMEECRRQGIKTEMIYTGQTGWLQGYPYGFIFDSTLNDFVSGEMEKAVMDCDKDLQPDVILLEGQSSLRNPSGPCGSEFILSADARGVFLLHSPKRVLYDHTEIPLPTLESEIELYKMYGAEVLGIALNEEDADDAYMEEQKQELSEKLGLPVVRPLVDGVGDFIPALRAFMGKRQG
jgi:uncharacterized NAD-dependent epimerase/dehydratase family protein